MVRLLVSSLYLFVTLTHLPRKQSPCSASSSLLDSYTPVGNNGTPPLYQAVFDIVTEATLQLQQLWLTVANDDGEKKEAVRVNIATSLPREAAVVCA